MTLREYVIAVSDEIDERYLSDEHDVELAEKLKESIMIEVLSYHERNIAPEMAAEFIANKLNLVKD